MGGMAFDPIIAGRRFGCGLSPTIAAPRSVPEMLATLTSPDRIAENFPIEDFPSFRERMALKQREIRAGRRAKNDAERRLLETKVRKIKGAARRAAVGWFHMHLMRRTWTKDGFRERLTGFWADHFTTRGRAGIIKRGASPFVETAIRPILPANSKIC